MKHSNVRFYIRIKLFNYLLCQVIIFIIYILTGIFGTELWKFEIFGVSSGALSEAMMYCGSLVSGLPMSFYNIYCSYRDKTGKMLGPVEALRPFISLTVLFAACTTWVLHSPTDILNRDPRLFTFFIGVVFANINVSL